MRTAILGGIRTPFTRAGQETSDLIASDLGVIAVRELLARVPVPLDRIDEVIAGCGGPASNEANVARVIALRCGLDRSISAFTVQRNCASGFQALTTAHDRIAAGRGSLFLVVGTESMSSYPLIYGREMTTLFRDLAQARTMSDRVSVWGRFRPRFLKPRLGIIEGLSDGYTGESMGRTAETLASEFRISRERQDEYALRSHQRATKAEDAGVFREESVPIFEPTRQGRAKARAIVQDQGIRRDQRLEKLARLKPVFDRTNGTVTAGNSCQVTDGACAFLVASEECAEELGMTALGHLRDYAYVGLDPSHMGLGPVHATAQLLDRNAITLESFDRIELNEAFAAQVLACQEAFESATYARRELRRDAAIGKLDLERTNVHGGAIALGHPVGATGARLVLTLLTQMAREGLDRGLATLCIGGGQGGALWLERA
ncbi:MAG: acetyl-CoA C-acyltransferase [Planctomycetes bacterium]|nr:acetyl-CoA C-acyltransferase [Planctomycetota bacterium]